jgi:hypothetical protein
MQPTLPQVRGPISDALLAHLRNERPLTLAFLPDLDPLTDDDLHVSLWICYQLHYGGFTGVADDREWDLAVLGLRRRLEERFESALRAEHGAAQVPEDPVTALRVIGTWAGPPLSSTVEEHGTRQQLCEFAVHRSAYQL